MPLSYLEWNQKFFDYYFNEDNQGNEVQLYADQALIETLGGDKEKLEDFLNTIKQWDGYSKSQNFCQRAHQTMVEWREHPKRFNCPPYIAYLVFFVFVSTTNDPVEGRDSYHRKLNILLDQPDRDIHPQQSFYSIFELWEDLEHWTTITKKGKYGQYTKWSHGRFDHVGVPLSQSLISYEEKKRLPCIFFRANLSPDFLPSEEFLRISLITYGESGKNKLSSRLINFLKENRPDNNIADEKRAAYKLFLKFVINELVNWDRTGCETEGSQGIGRPRINANICLLIDRLGLSSGIRIKYPPRNNFQISSSAPLFYNNTRKKITLFCKESPGQNDWSKRLEVEKKGIKKTWDISEETEIWERGLSLTDNNGHVIATLPESENGLRVFLPGGFFNLMVETWIESYRLNWNRDFLIMCKKDQSEKIIRWGNSACDSFSEIKDISIGSRDLKFFKGKNATVSLSGFNKLSLPNVTNIRLEGGLRKKGDRNRVYLQVAPPIVSFEGGFGDEIALLKTGGSLVTLTTKSQGSLKWEIPYDTPVGELLKVEVGKYDDKGEWLKSDHITFTLLPTDLSIKKDLPKRGAFGEQLDDRQNDQELKNFVIGANVFR